MKDILKAASKTMTTNFLSAFVKLDGNQELNNIQDIRCVLCLCSEIHRSV